jgi:hypothetical protein
MPTNPLHRALIALHTLLGTWDRYPYGVHYCATCDRLYDWWLGCAGCGRPACDARLLGELVGLLRGPVRREHPGLHGRRHRRRVAPVVAGHGHGLPRGLPLGPAAAARHLRLPGA